MNIKIFGNNPKLWQWDTGRKLIVEDGGICNEIHFANAATETAVPVSVLERDGLRVAEIPDGFLRKAIPLAVYLYQDGENGDQTVSSFTFRVEPRVKPENYGTTEGVTTP